jgi:hypothetical protein
MRRIFISDSSEDVDQPPPSLTNGQAQAVMDLGEMIK